MAAEDYFPGSPGDSADTDFEEGGVGYGSQGFDREWDTDSTYQRAEHLVTCKRCGQPNLHWENAKGDWRLFPTSGTTHSCPHPAPGVVHFPSIMAPTTKAFSIPASPTKESPIMDKNAVAFIRNDVRTLTVAFIDSEKGNTEHYSAEALRQRAMPYQKYTYLTIDPSIQEGDWALVEVNGFVKSVYVVTASDELTIEPNAPVEYRFIVGKIELAQYRQLLDQNAKIADLLRASYRSSIREGFRNTLLSGLPQDQQTTISLLLSKD